MDSVSSLWGNLKRSKIHIIVVPEGEEKEQEIGKLVEKNNEKKKTLPWFGEGSRDVSPGRTESLKQDGCKEAHSKAHHN